VKIRLGLDDPDEFHALLQVLNDYPLSAVIVHPRTGAQMYKGSVDLTRYARILTMCVHPTIYNGDITTPAFFSHLRALYPTTAAWMIGRGILGDPFLPTLIRGRELPKNPSKRIEAFHNDLYERFSTLYSGPSPLLGAMKELWGYLAQGFSDGDKLLKSIRKAKKRGEYERITSEFFAGSACRTRAVAEEKSR
ncbi:MAG: tRNA-dihydrouridine synthase family protein, partial [Chitinivibrionales bacterium]|nr:tRNA-dihydrouridine synthase family protein [Chitinivibrionales bacterium]